MRSRLLILLLLLVGMLPALEQEATGEAGEHPIFDLLSWIPDDEDSRAGVVYYTDWRAAETVLPIVPSPESFDQWLALGMWVWPYLRISSEPAFNFLTLYDRTPEVLGMDFFDIDRTLYAGIPPSNIFIYAGEFDTAAISGTLARRDESADGPGQYEQAEINGIEAWCWLGGCDQGMRQDLMGRDPANLLDPSGLGRNPPVFLTASAIAFSFDLATMETMASAINGETPSLADADDFRALAEAITSDEQIRGRLVQAHFIQPRDAYLVLDFNDPASTMAILGPQFSRDNAEAVLSELAESADFANYATLPPYTQVVIADHQGEGELFASIGLVYSSESDAQTAADELAGRLGSYRDVLVRGDEGVPFIKDLQGTMQTPQVFESSTGHFVALVSVSYPIPDHEARPAPPPGLLFRAWVQGISRRGFYPLWDVVQAE